MKVFDQLESLVAALGRDVRTAEGIESPNEGDDLVIRTGIVGFSYNSPTGEWTRDHFDFLRRRMECGFALTHLEGWGVEPGVLQLFAALCIGYLLGLYHSRRITDDEFQRHETYIAALIALYSSELTLDAAE